MDRQFNQLAGAPLGSLVGPETCACSVVSIGDANVNVVVVATLLEAFESVLVAEEVLLGAALQGAANGVRSAVEAIRAVARETIEYTIETQGDASTRVALLGHAVTLEGADSPLVSRIALTFAATAISPTGA